MNNLQPTLSRISGIRELRDDERIQMEYLPYNDTKPMVFVDEQDEVVGYVWFTINKENILFINMIEMIKKEEGYGTEAISLLFSHYSVSTICGVAMREPGMRPYWFWDSLGAEMQISAEEAEYTYEDIPFTLYR